jgi:hypothetical protein
VDPVKLTLDADELLATWVDDDVEPLPTLLWEPFDPQATAAAVAISRSPEIRKERMMVQSLGRVPGRQA